MNHPQTQSLHTCQSVSDAFLALHAKDGFAVLPPSSLLHESVRMSFVMSAGLIQVENDLDQIVEKTGGKFVFTQPCFRHFDVKQVGQDTTHLSLFHMSAAFNIDNTDRENILPRLWYFMTETLSLEKSRLWITYLDDEKFGCDERTKKCWSNLGVQPNRLIGLDRNHCFWKQRKTGKIARDGKKCGPHTEVFYERIEVECSKCSAHPELMGLSCHCGRFVEVSNSLFIENYISNDDSLIASDTVFSESVIGAERLAMIMQKVSDVHQVDRFQRMWSDLYPFLSTAPQSVTKGSVRIIIDHISAFITLADDGAPKAGRGGQANIMRKLSRGAMGEILRCGLPVRDILEALVSQYSQKAYSYLIEEWLVFDKTISRVLKEIERNYRNNQDSSCWRSTRQKGVPDFLLERHHHYLLQKRLPVALVQGEHNLISNCVKS